MTAPAPAKKILDYIAKVEVGTQGPEGYDVLYGHNKISPRLTTRTLDNAILNGPVWTRKHGSSAAGRYQFMNETLKDLKAKFRLDGSLVLTPDLQDDLGWALLRRRGLDRFLAGQMTTDSFMLEIAKEWASFPVPFKTQGRHQIVNRGDSYYKTGANVRAPNKSLVDASKVWIFLERLRYEYATGPELPPDMPPQDTSSHADEVATLWQALVKAWEAYVAARNKA